MERNAFGVTCLFNRRYIGGLFASFMSSQSLTFIAIILLGFALVMSFMGGADFGDKERFTMNRKTVLSFLELAL